MADNPYFVGVQIGQLNPLDTETVQNNPQGVQIPVQVNGISFHITVAQILTAILEGQPLQEAISDALDNWIVNLPTDPPSQSGKPWNNGGTISIS